MILFTGGSGLLGSEFKLLFPKSLFPIKHEFNVTNPSQMRYFMMKQLDRIDTVVHCAAQKDQRKINLDPLIANTHNIIGTANLVDVCARWGIRLVYISTDYVFDGHSGPYNEESATNPVNKYGLSKLGGECAVRLYDRSLVIRTSFGPKEFAFPHAFEDQVSCREVVDVIARKIKPLITSSVTGIVNVGGEPRTVLEYARSINPLVQPIKLLSVDIKIPRDTTLITRKYEQIIGGL